METRAAEFRMTQQLETTMEDAMNESHSGETRFNRTETEASR